MSGETSNLLAAFRSQSQVLPAQTVEGFLEEIHAIVATKGSFHGPIWAFVS
jgi:hypothetical protein